jgi:hypothetical protein
MLTQAGLNDLYTGNQIKIGLQAAHSSNFMAVCLMFSGGIPLMYPIGMLYFIFQYWCEKYFIMRFH